MLDTNIVSYLLREQMPDLKSRFLSAPPADVTVSTITEAEVHFGIAKKPGAAKLRLAAENFLAGIAVLPWDSVAARAYGPLRYLRLMRPWYPTHEDGIKHADERPGYIAEHKRIAYAPYFSICSLELRHSGEYKKNMYAAEAIASP